LAFHPEDVKVTKGKLKDFADHDTKSGIPLIRQFCPTCGSNVLVIYQAANLVHVQPGTLDGEATWVPTWESFPQKRKEWVKVLLG